MKRTLLAISALLLVAAVAGCRFLAPPNLSRPGTADYQQGRARVYDPYPTIEAAPQIVGGRPRQYQSPRAEVVRTQLRPEIDWLPRNWKRQ